MIEEMLQARGISRFSKGEDKRAVRKARPLAGRSDCILIPKQHGQASMPEICSTLSLRKML